MKNQRENHETAYKALDALSKVREEMIHLVTAGEMTSADFTAINALEKQLIAYADKTAPKYEPISLACLFSEEVN